MRIMISSEEDRFHEECGVVGVYGHPEAANLAYLALYALQHRGQESAGIVSSRGDALISHRGLGLVADIFDPGDHPAPGRHRCDRSQPLRDAGRDRAARTRSRWWSSMPAGRSRWRTTATSSTRTSCGSGSSRAARSSSPRSDTEVIIHLIAQAQGETLLDRVVAALSEVRGAYSLVFLSRDQLIVARDPLGFRPLVLGRVRDAHVVVSETCALDLMNATVRARDRAR